MPAATSAGRPHRAPLPPSRPARPGPAQVTATASTGSWTGTPVAVVTAGRDVTLAVGPTWQVVGGWWPSLGVDTPSLGTVAPGGCSRSAPTRARARPLDRTPRRRPAGHRRRRRGRRGRHGDGPGPLGPAQHGRQGQDQLRHGLRRPEGPGRDGRRRATGLPIEGYVLLGFTGFKRIVDDQGGPTDGHPAHRRRLARQGSRHQGRPADPLRAPRPSPTPASARRCPTATSAARGTRARSSSRRRSRRSSPGRQRSPAP